MNAHATNRTLLMPVRHLLAVALLVAAWKSLDLWYIRTHTMYYLLFAACGLISVALGLFPVFQRLFHGSTVSRKAIVVALLFLSLPWGEWIGLSLPSSRLTWSFLLLIHLAFLYGYYLIWSTFAGPRLWGARLSAGLERLSSRNVLWIPPLLFLGFTIWIAFFLYDQTPVVQDSAGHLFQGSIFASGNWFAPAPPAPDSFSFQGDMLIIHNGRWFGMYLPGFALLLGAAMKLHGEWLVSPLLGSLTVALWIEYARRWHSRKTALLMGILCLFSPFLFMMSSTVMIHTPEIFLDSAAVYLLRRELETPSLRIRILLGVVMLCAAVTRGFSILVFLCLPLVYVAARKLRNRPWQMLIPLACGLAVGAAFVILFQFKTTGDPWTGGYALEYDRPHTMGFGENISGLVHTPLKGFEQASNSLLGIDHYLNGWYTGSLVFVLVFLLSTGYLETWDKLLLGSCGLLMLFYYFYVIQDLVFGPRFLYPLATVLLLFTARLLARKDSRGHAAILLATISLAAFFPARMPEFLQRYNPDGRQAGQLRHEMLSHRGEKLLVFLDRHVAQDFINWNDPFLRNGIILCRDLGTQQNSETLRHFPGYVPTYFRLTSLMENGKIKSGYWFQPDPDSKPAGYLSLFEFASAMQSAAGLPVDFFDITYTDLLKWDDSRDQLRYLSTQEDPRPEERSHQASFRKGVIHAARLAILPKEAYEQYGDRWLDALDDRSFVAELTSALRMLQDSGDAGRPLVDELRKVAIRIDRNQDGIYSKQEIAQFLSKKKLLLLLA